MKNDKDRSHARSAKAAHINVSLSKDELAEFDALCASEGRNRSNMFRRIIAAEKSWGTVEEHRKVYKTTPVLPTEAEASDVVSLRKATRDLLESLAKSEGKTPSQVIDDLVVKAIDPSVEHLQRSDPAENRSRQTLTKDGFNESLSGNNKDSGMVATARRKTARGKSA